MWNCQDTPNRTMDSGLRRVEVMKVAWGWGRFDLIRMHFITSAEVPEREARDWGKNKRLAIRGLFGLGAKP